MIVKQFKKIFLMLLCLVYIVISDEFNSEGPYGVLYFDTAAPFTVSDLNASLSGDVNLDETVNIQDILLIINNVLGNINFNTEQNQQADTNNDNIIDINDINSLVSSLLRTSF